MSEPPDIAGRGSEVDAVHACMRSGSPLLILGEPGMGKSRLVQAAAESAADVRVAIGHCLPLSVPLPLLPLADVLRQLGAGTQGELSQILSALPRWVATELTRLTPELGAEAGSAPTDLGEDDGWRRQRLFEALRQTFAALAARRPLAVVIEDLHWADEATLDALSYLTAPSHRVSLSVVLTCREVVLSEPVARWIDQFSSVPGTSQLALHELDVNGTRHQLELALGHDVGPERSARFHARSGGNPLYTEQLSALMGSDPDAPMPRSLESLLAARLSGVAGLRLEILQALAIADRPLPEDLLLAICPDEASEVADATGWLVRQRLVGEAPSEGTHDRYQLRHALFGEVLRGRMHRRDRSAMHSRLADHLLQRQPLDEPALVADHLAASGRSSEELGCRIAAAVHAESVFAPVEALLHFRRAVSLWQDLVDHEGDVTRLGRPQARVGLGDAQMSVLQMWRRTWMAAERSGRSEDALVIGSTALARLWERSSVAEMVTLYCDLGHLRRVESQSGALVALDEAIALGGTLDTHADLVRAHGEYAGILSMAGDFTGARAHVARAEEMLGIADPATRLNLGALDAWLLAALGYAARSSARLAGVMDAVGEVDPVSRLELEGRIGDLLLDSGELAPAVSRGLAALDAAATVGVTRSFWTDVLRFNVCEALVEGGDVGRAAAVLGMSAVMADAIVDSADSSGESMMLAIVRADVAMRRGEPRVAAAIWDAGTLTGGFTSMRREYAVRRLEHAIWNEPADGLYEHLRDTVGILRDVCATDQSQFVGTLLSMAVRACADYAESARDRNDPEALGAALSTLQDLDTALAGAPRDPFAAAGLPVSAAAHGSSWTSERRRVLGVVDPESWRRTANAWQKLGRPHRAAYAFYRQAEGLLGDRHERRAAVTVLRLAASLADGHRPLSAAVHELAQRARIDLGDPVALEAPALPGVDQGVGKAAAVPAGGSGGGAVPAQLRGVTLTERESAVLSLLVEGRTNAEIGARLYISPKTAGVHVTNILRKLGVTSRVQAAVIGARASSDRQGSA